MQRNPISLSVLFSFFVCFSLGGQPRVAEPAQGFGISHSSSVEELSQSGEMNLEYLFACFDEQTPIDMELNEAVREQINSYLTFKRRDIEIALQRAELYFPLFEEMLDKYDLPLELKYLAVVESGLNPLAKSPSGAVGLWQFLYTTCSLFDLRVDSYIDERRDPYKSTEAACKYLNYLYRTYADWNLVMASYNGGPGDVRKAIERSGGKTDYWEIRPYLSAQARNYVPVFMAISYLMSHAGQYKYRPLPAEFRFEDTDTLLIHYGVSFQQISQVLPVSIDQLELLNPVYKRRYIPDMKEPCKLVLPAGLVPQYLRNENKILSVQPFKTNYIALLADAACTEDRKRITHTVQSGEFCHKIALNYDCTIENIKAWNNLTTTMLYPGQILDIWIKYTK